MQGLSSIVGILGCLVGGFVLGCESSDAAGTGDAGASGAGGTAPSDGGAAGAAGGAAAGAAGSAGSAGASGAGGSAGSAGSAGSSGSAGAAGAGPCTAIDAASFVFGGLDDVLPAAHFIGEVSPNLYGAEEEVMNLELFSDETGSFDLSAAPNDNYATCDQCVRVMADVSTSSLREFFQESGTVTLDGSVGPFSGGILATLEDVRLVEVDIDMNGDYHSTPVVGGDCLLLSGPVVVDIPAPPPEWTCSPPDFDDGSTCHCECGTWDPDCDVAGAELEGCSAGQSCVDPGKCEGIPTDWSCDPNEFANGGDCNCECGAYDPDCDSGASTVIGCATSEYCASDARCLPEGWSCFPSFYDAQDGCDCNCGVWDKDCEDPSQEVFGCAEEEPTQACLDAGKCE